MLGVAVVVHFAGVICGVVAISRLAGQRSPPRWAVAACALGAAALVAVSFWASSPPVPFYDYLIAYHPAGQAMLTHDAAKLRALTGLGVSGFVNMPVVAYAFAPLGLLPPLVGAALFTLGGVVALVAAWQVLCRLAGLERRERWLLALLLAASGPMMNGLKFGNTSYFLLWALAAGLAWLRAGRSASAGALLGAAAIAKPALLLYGAFFVFRRDWRGVLGLGGVLAAVSAASLALFGWADNLAWFERIILQFSQGWATAHTVQSIPGFIYRLGAGPDVLLDWLPHVPTAAQRAAARILTGALALVAAVAWVRGSFRGAPDQEGAAARLDLQYLLVLALCLVTSPLSWSHYYLWLLLPAALFLGGRTGRPLSRVEHWLGWLAIALITPLVEWPIGLSSPTLMALYQKVYTSHLLFGGLLWFGLIAWWLARVAPAPTSSARSW